ncbi:unnamed protein product [Polarella glacialis]|uniref:DJ-1/PfpI domain-containing protein n=2 Tax=Polarella glacialis TaxID=89957 RepID=A0A813HMH6_POLGL|nr:unnamed protein product [Polarella glacialis]
MQMMQGCLARNPFARMTRLLGSVQCSREAGSRPGPQQQQKQKPLTMAVVLFPGFELLDVAAPGELLGAVPDVARLFYAAQFPGPIASSCSELAGGTVGPSLVATHRLLQGGSISDAAGGQPFKPDAIFIPGGKGVRGEVSNDFLVDWMREAAHEADVVLTVCTGSWLLGVSGALDGIPATSNKNALRNGHPQKAAPNVLWQLEARWVEHELRRSGGRTTLFITSSGVSAGGDAALALIARRAGMEVARRVAHRAEWSWQEDSSVDPFARDYGL